MCSDPASNQEAIASEVLALANGIRAYNGWAFIAPKVLRRIESLAELHGVEHVRQAAGRTQRSQKPNLFLDDLALAAAPELTIEPVAEPVLTLVPDTPRVAAYVPDEPGPVGPDRVAERLAAARAQLGPDRVPTGTVLAPAAVGQNGTDV